MGKDSAGKAAAARRLQAGLRYSEVHGLKWKAGALERADVFLKGLDALYNPLTAREIATLRATIRRNLRPWAAGKVRVIPLVADPAIQATERLVQRCEEFANALPGVLKDRETRRAQQFMLALSETLTTTSEVFETKVSKDTALVAQRQFRDRFKRCLSRFDWCCEALLDSVSAAEHTRALRARLKGDLTVEAFAPGTSVGLHISGLYCLWLSWAEVAAQFVLAQGSREKMFAFKTDTLGEPFDEQTTKLHADAFTLKASRAKLPEGTIPKWAVALSATVDTQHRFFKGVVRAWGPTADGGGMESARIWHGRLETFNDLDTMLLARWWGYEDSAYPPIRLHLLLIDTGGTQLESEEISRTMEVYRWVHERARWSVRAIKGARRAHGAEDAIHIWPSKAIQQTGQGASTRHQRTDLTLWMLDVHHYADELADLVSRGRKNEAEEIWHLNTRNDAEYNQELSNCVKVVERVGNHLEEVWRPVSEGAVIDYFDCEVYQVAAAYMMQVHTLPSRQVIDARRQEIMRAAALEAQQARGREAQRKLEEESETHRRHDDAWTPRPF